MMLSNNILKLLLICFFINCSTTSTLALNEKHNGTKEIRKYGQEPEVLYEGSYLVIGVFKNEANARHLTNKALQDGLVAHYRIHSENGFFYVYTYSDSSKNNVINAYYQMRSDTRYKDAWILTVNSQADQIMKDGLDYHEATAILPLGIESVEKDGLRQETDNSKASDKVTVCFQILNQLTGDSVKADIQLVDGKRAKLIDHIQSDSDWVLDKKDVGLDTIQIITQAIGYKKSQVDLNLQDPLNTIISPVSNVRNDTIFVKLEMQELDAGDTQIMYNTYFYGNATVMRIQSSYELEEVYKLLNRNPNMRIKLHGHTNGNSRGKAYLYLENKKNFFELERTKDYQKKGLSAVKLSAYRAETIKSYLMHRGIASDRIETMGWGGKKMLYGAESPLAKNNIRVEIEILNK